MDSGYSSQLGVHTSRSGLSGFLLVTRYQLLVTAAGVVDAKNG